MAKISSDTPSPGFRSDKINNPASSASGSDIQSLNSLINSIMAGNTTSPPQSGTSPKIS